MFTLRPYQNDTISDVFDSYNNGIRRQLVVLATGLGKTVIATQLVNKFRTYFLSKKLHPKALFLVDQVELVDQAAASLKRALPELNVGIEQASRKIRRDADIVVACVPTIGRENSKRILKFDPDQFGLVICDETHKAVSKTWLNVLNYFGVGPDNQAPDKLLIGLTATPNRTDGVKLGKIFDDITVNYDLSWGIRNGWLTDIEVYNVKTTTDISHVKTVGDDFAKGELNDAVNNAQRNAQIVQSYKQYAQGQRAFIYAASVQHAYELQKLFELNDIQAGVIEANTDKSERKKMLAEHKSGNGYSVLLNYGTLTTGVDSPKTSICMITRPIKSELVYRQIIGRVLRPDPSAEVDQYHDLADTRKFMIELSAKPVAKVIDFEDVTGKHQTMSVPSLFGLSRKIAEDKPRFHKDVVEVIESKEHELGVDLSHVENIDDIDLIVERHKGNLGSLQTPQEIHSFTDNAWIELGASHYELTLSSSGVSMIIVKDKLDNFETRVYDHKKQETYKLQSFKNLSGAFNMADRYAKENYDTAYQNRKAEWRGQGVTTKQAQILARMLKGGLSSDPENRYPDTGVPILTYKGEILTRGTASNLMNTLFARK